MNVRTTGPIRLQGAFDAEAVVALIRAAFAAMEHRIDPPSSVGRLDAATLRAQAVAGEIWAMLETDRPVACVVMTPMPDSSLYLGKLAVATPCRGRGLARALVTKAVERARVLGFTRLVVQSRIELTEVHAAFEAMGFRRIASTAHPGYDRPTSITMARAVPEREEGSDL